MIDFQRFLSESFYNDDHEYHHNLKLKLAGVTKSYTQSLGIKTNDDLTNRIAARKSILQTSTEYGKWGYHSATQTLHTPSDSLSEKLYSTAVSRHGEEKGTALLAHLNHNALFHELGHAEHYTMHPSHFMKFTDNVKAAARADFENIDSRRLSQHINDARHEAHYMHPVSDTYHAAGGLKYNDPGTHQRFVKSIGSDHGAHYYYHPQGPVLRYQRQAVANIRPHQSMVGEIVANITGARSVPDGEANKALKEHFPHTYAEVSKWHDKL